MKTIFFNMEKNEYFTYTDKFLEKMSGDKLLSITDVKFSILPDIMNTLMGNSKNYIIFTNSSFVDSFNYNDIIIKTPSMYLYFSRVSNETMYQLRIIHENNIEEIKIFLKGLKLKNKL